MIILVIALISLAFHAHAYEMEVVSSIIRQRQNEYKNVLTKPLHEAYLEYPNLRELQHRLKRSYNFIENYLPDSISPSDENNVVYIAIIFDAYSRYAKDYVDSTSTKPLALDLIQAIQNSVGIMEKDHDNRDITAASRVLHEFSIHTLDMILSSGLIENVLAKHCDFDECNRLMLYPRQGGRCSTCRFWFRSCYKHIDKCKESHSCPSGKFVGPIIATVNIMHQMLYATGFKEKSPLTICVSVFNWDEINLKVYLKFLIQAQLITQKYGPLFFSHSGTDLILVIPETYESKWFDFREYSQKGYLHYTIDGATQIVNILPRDYVYYSYLDPFDKNNLAPFDYEFESDFVGHIINTMNPKMAKIKSLKRIRSTFEKILTYLSFDDSLSFLIPSLKIIDKTPLFADQEDCEQELFQYLDETRPPETISKPKKNRKNNKKKAIATETIEETSKTTEPETKPEIKDSRCRDIQKDQIFNCDIAMIMLDFYATIKTPDEIEFDKISHWSSFQEQLKLDTYRFFQLPEKYLSLFEPLKLHLDLKELIGRTIFVINNAGFKVSNNGRSLNKNREIDLHDLDVNQAHRNLMVELTTFILKADGPFTVDVITGYSRGTAIKTSILSNLIDGRWYGFKVEEIKSNPGRLKFKYENE